MNKNVIIFGNNRGICQKLANAFNETGYNAELAMVSGHFTSRVVRRIVEDLKEKQLILAFKNEELKDLTERFYNYGITHLFVFPWDTHYFENDNAGLIDGITRIDNSKPRLDYLEIEVSECCNLNCKGCNEFSNLVKEKRYGNLESVRKDLQKLKELFWGIGRIRLMGGEPLINPDFLQFVITARKIFPDSDIRLLTNGLQIPNLKKVDLVGIKNYNCSFDISQYPPTRKIISEIDSCLKKAEIPYNLSILNKYFFKSLLREPADSPSEAFENCLFSHCHAVSGGYLSACSNQLYAYRLNEAFDLDFPTNDKIDIYKTELTGWQINELFKKPHDFCRYCGKGMVPYKWKTCTSSKARASDWLIEPTFINLKIMPVVQKTVKSLMKKMRYIIQRPKSKRFK